MADCLKCESSNICLKCIANKILLLTDNNCHDRGSTNIYVNCDVSDGTRCLTCSSSFAWFEGINVCGSIPFLFDSSFVNCG